MTHIQTATKTNAARRLWSWLGPFTSRDEEQQRIGLAVRFFGVSAVVAMLPFVFIEWFHGWMLQARFLVLIEFVIIGALWLNRRGHSNVAALVLNGTALVAGAVLVFVSAEGFRDVSLLLFPAIPVVAALLMPRRYYWPMSAAVVLVAAILIFLQIHGLLPNAPKAGGYHELLGAAVILSNISVLAGYLVATLAASNRFSQATIDALPYEVCVLDGNGRVLAVNRAWRRFADANPPVPPGAFVGANYLEVCERATGREAADAASFAAGLRAVLRGEAEDFAMEYPSTPHEAECCFSALVTRFPGTGAAQVVITHEDITPRRRAEERLRISEEQHRQLVQHLPAGVVVHAPDRRILLANTQACRLLGVSEDQIRGMRAREWVWTLLGEDGIPLRLEEYPVNRVLSSRAPVRDLVAAVKREDADMVWLLINAFPEFTSEKELRQVVVIFADITERRLFEKERRQLEEKLT
jgi:PAS domain S-box-containing protein